MLRTPLSAISFKANESPSFTSHSVGFPWLSAADKDSLVIMKTDSAAYTSITFVPDMFSEETVILVLPIELAFT